MWCMNWKTDEAYSCCAAFQRSSAGCRRLDPDFQRDVTREQRATGDAIWWSRVGRTRHQPHLSGHVGGV